MRTKRKKYVVCAYSLVCRKGALGKRGLFQTITPVGRPLGTSFRKDAEDLIAHGREIAPYSELGAKQKRERLDLMRRVVEYISGGDLQAATADLGGGVDIIGEIKDARNASAGKDVRTLEFKVNAAQFLAPEMTRMEMCAKGTTLGVQGVYSGFPC